MNYQPQSLEKRFWKKVAIVEDLFSCWEWQGYTDKKGYGRMLSAGSHSKLLLTHRVGYILQNGPLKNGDLVLHSCDNPPCVRGGHLHVGDHSANLQEAYARGLRPSLRKIEGNEEDAIRALLTNQHLSQTEVGRMFNVHQSVISRIANKKRYLKT